MKQNKRGISLIVLVITIIVIIILATAVILTINNNNPMDNANKARYTSDRANVQDALSTAVGKIAADKLCSVTIPAQANIANGIVYDLTGASNGVAHGIIGWDTLATGEPVSYEKTTILGMKIPNYGSNTRWFINGNGDVAVEIAGVVYGPGGTIGKSIVPGDIASEDTGYTVNGKTAVIPKGFYISKEAEEQSIDGGLVVVAPDGTDDTKASEFVWVPIDDVAKIFSEDSANPGQYVGELKAYFKMGDKNGTTIDPKYREPDNLTDPINGDTPANLSIINGILGISLKDGDAFKVMMQDEVKAMYASIQKNKGFYIGRYETGDLSKDKVVSNIGNSDISHKTWHMIYAKQRKYASQFGTSIQSTMIYGSQWDAVLRWIATDPDTNIANYAINAEGRGNWSSSVKPTGDSKSFAVKNIYDMAGNVYDWTAEAITTYNRVLRGGGYPNSTASQYAGCRDYDPSSRFGDYGSRLVLYL